MQVHSLVTRDDALSPVLGFALVLGSAILLGLVVVTFIMGLGDTVGDESPEVEFSFEYDPDATTQDSFGSSGGTFDGLLTITHEGGTVLEAERLAVVGASSQPVRGEFSDPATPYAPDDEVSPGTELSVYVREDDDVRVVWRPPDGGDSSPVARWGGPGE